MARKIAKKMIEQPMFKWVPLFICWIITLTVTMTVQADPIVQSPAVVLNMSVLSAPISMNAKRSAIRAMVGWPMINDVKIKDLIRAEHYVRLRRLAPQHFKEWTDYLTMFGLRLALSDEEISAYLEQNKPPLLGEKSSIEALDLSKNARYILNHREVKLVGDITKVSIEDLRRVNGAGNSTVNEIVERFRRLGFVIPATKSESDSLTTLGLSPRAYRTLWRLGITTISQLKNISDEALYTSAGAGEQTIQEIEDLLERFGIYTHIDPTTDYSLYRAGLEFKYVYILHLLGVSRLSEVHKISIQDLKRPEFKLRKDSVQKIRRILFNSGYPLSDDIETRAYSCTDIMGAD